MYHAFGELRQLAEYKSKDVTELLFQSLKGVVRSLNTWFLAQ